MLAWLGLYGGVLPWCLVAWVCLLHGLWWFGVGAWGVGGGGWFRLWVPG